MAFVGGNFHGIHTDNQLGQSLERMWNEQRWMTKDEALAVLMNPAPYWTHNVAINDMQERNNSFFRLITEAAYAVLVDNSEAGPLHGNQWVNYTLHGRAYEYPLDLRSSLPANPDQQLRFPCFELRGKHRGRRRWVFPANYQQLTGNPNPGGVLIQWRVFPTYDKLHWRHAAHALRQQQEAANGGPLPRPMGVPGVGSPAAPLPLPPGTRAPRGRLPQFPGAPPLQYPAIPPAGGHVADGDGGNNDNDHGHGRGHGRGHGGGGGGGGAGGAGGGRGHAGAGGHGMYGAQGGAGGHAWGGAPGGAGGAGGNIHFHGDFHLTSIKNDDKVIQAEGVESLSEEELRQACREELRDWLDPSLNHAMPSALRVLLRRMKPEEAVVATTSSLPDEVVDTVGTVLPSEDSVSERRKKLEFLEMQEELIKEEEKKKEKEEKAKQKKEEKAKLKEPEADEQDLALKEMTEPTAREEEELREGKQRDKEQLCNISRALTVLASASSVSKERQEFLSLVNQQEIGLYNSMIEKEGTDGEEAKRAYMAAREEEDDSDEVAAEEKVSSALIEQEEGKKKEKEEKAKQKKEEKAKLKEPEADEQDLALKEMTEPTAREELREGKQRDKEQLCNISRVLTVLASASSVSKELQEFLSLVKQQEIGLYNSMIEKEGTDGEEAKRAYMAAREEEDDSDEIAAEEKVSSALIEKVDAMLQELEKEINDVDAQIGNRWQLLDRDHDGKVTPEVAAAAAYLKDTIGKEGVQVLSAIYL